MTGTVNVDFYMTGTVNVDLYMIGTVNVDLYMTGTEAPQIPRWLISLGISFGGLVALHMFFGHHIVYLLVCAALVYLILLVASWRCQNLAGVVVAVFVFLYIVIW
jgi:hypothetical protein